MNKLVIWFLGIVLMPLSIIVGAEIFEENKTTADIEYMSSIFEQCYSDAYIDDHKNIFYYKGSLFNKALWNSNYKAVKNMLISAKVNDVKLVWYYWQLAEVIEKYDEETATLAVMHAPDLVPGLNDYTYYYNYTWSAGFLHLLMDNGFKFKYIHDVFLFKNANTETLKRVIGQESDIALFFEFDDFEKFLLDRHSNYQAMKNMLIFAEVNNIKLIKNSEQLFNVIKRCDEVTATLAVKQAPDLVPGLNDNDLYYNYSWSAVFLHLLMDNGWKLKGLDHLLYSNNTNSETLKRMIEQEKDKVLFFESADFEEFLLEAVEHGRLDWLRILESYGFSLKNFVALDGENLKALVCSAVISANDGNHEMMNYVVESLEAQGNPVMLLCAARIKDGILFNDLLNQGYSIDLEDPESFIGLLFATESQNLNIVEYFLKNKIDPNADPSIIQMAIFTNNIEAVELLISYGAKIGLLHVSAAAEMGSIKLIQYFEEKGYKIMHPGIFVAACGSSNLELIDFFLEKGSNIKDPNLLVSAVRKGQFEILKYLITKGANPHDLMALNEALRQGKLEIAKYLIENGARLDRRSFIYAGLGGKPEALQWVYEKTSTRIPNELETIFTQSQSISQNLPNDIRSVLVRAMYGEENNDIIKYTLENLVGKDSILIGITNEGHHFTDGIGGVVAKLMEQNENLFVLPLTKEIADNPQLMKKFSGFINPGAGDSYPRGKSSFMLGDMNKDKMEDFEHLYQQVISFAKDYDIPYLGVCSGNQHLVLNSGGYLQPVKDHVGSISVQFEKGSIPHFMTLLPSEKAKALQSCQLEDVLVENAGVAHGFAGVKERLGRNVKLGAVSKGNESVPEAVSYGHNQIGIQFHPERQYFNDVEGKLNRQRVLLDNFFDLASNYQRSRAYGLEQGFSFEEVRDSMRQGNEKVLKRLESCAKEGELDNSEHFWGKHLGSSTIKADNGASVTMLMGLTAKDLGLLRDGEDLVLVIKSTGEALSIKSHFAPNGEHRVKSIDFADGSRLMLMGMDEQIPHLFEDGKSVHVETQSNFYCNASKILTQ